MSDIRITVQRSRSGKRWGYVINEPGVMHFVSRHIYGSSEAAMEAGDRDALRSAAHRWLNGDPTILPPDDSDDGKHLWQEHKKSGGKETK